MLTPAQYGQIRAAFTGQIDRLGTPLDFTVAKNPAAGTRPVRCGFKSAGKNDEAIINAYGIHAIILTVKADDFVGIAPPEKFDQFSRADEVYVVQSAHPVHLNAEVIGYKMVVKGR